MLSKQLNSEIKKASMINKLNTVNGDAPTALQIAISLLRSFKFEKIIAAMPNKVVKITKIEIANKTFSTEPIIHHSSCSATPGTIARSGSSV